MEPVGVVVDVAVVDVVNDAFLRPAAHCLFSSFSYGVCARGLVGLASLFLDVIIAQRRRFADNNKT